MTRGFLLRDSRRLALENELKFDTVSEQISLSLVGEFDVDFIVDFLLLRSLVGELAYSFQGYCFIILIRLDYRLAKAFKSSFPLFSKLVARSNLGRFLKSNRTDFLKLGLETPSKLLTEIFGCTDSRPINA